MLGKRNRNTYELELKVPAEIPVAYREQVAGFFDGDGCVIFSPSKRQDGTLCLKFCVVFTQSGAFEAPTVLTEIQKYYGGRVVKGEKRAKEQHRQKWNLIVQAKSNLSFLLTHLAQYSILKLPQVLAAIEFSKIEKPTREQIFQTKETLAHLKELSEYRKVNIDATRLTPGYLGGFWTAEGSVGIYEDSRRKASFKIHLHFSQKSSPKLLEAMHVVFDKIGCLQEYDLSFNNPQSCKIILDLIKDHVIGTKRQQIEVVLEYCAFTSANVYAKSEEEVKKIQNWSARLMELKKQ